MLKAGSVLTIRIFLEAYQMHERLYPTRQCE